jgi:hypothetical protein
MANRPLGELADAVQGDVSAIVGDISSLAKAELSSDGAKLGVGVGAFVVALSGLPLALILGAFAAAEGFVAAGLARWAAYLLAAGVVVVVAALLVLIGWLTMRRLEGPKRTLQAIRDLIAALSGHAPGEAPGPPTTASPQAPAPESPSPAAPPPGAPA